MIYTDVSKPTYANSEGTAINCWVKFEAFENAVPFTASQTDIEVYSREIYKKLLSGDYGPIAPFMR